MLMAPVIPASAGWNGNPYFEYRHSIISNEPSLIGASDCPCYGYEAIVGFEANMLGMERWKLDISAGVVGQTRYDDPEVYNFNVNSNFRMSRRLHFLIGYREAHNLDRPTPGTTQFIDYAGLKERAPGGLWWGKSGASTLWAGVRWSFR